MHVLVSIFSQGGLTKDITTNTKPQTHIKRFHASALQTRRRPCLTGYTNHMDWMFLRITHMNDTSLVW